MKNIIRLKRQRSFQGRIQAATWIWTTKLLLMSFCSAIFIHRRIVLAASNFVAECRRFDKLAVEDETRWMTCSSIWRRKQKSGPRVKFSTWNRIKRKSGTPNSCCIMSTKVLNKLYDGRSESKREEKLYQERSKFRPCWYTSTLSQRLQRGSGECGYPYPTCSTLPRSPTTRRQGEHLHCSDTATVNNSFWLVNRNSPR